jgi:hypothetical protein
VLPPRRGSNLLLGTIVAIATVVVSGVTLFSRTGTIDTSPAIGRDHIRGAASAPVIVEEWSDFQ